MEFHVRLYAISIHSLRMEGDRPPSVSLTHASVISIHSLRMEGDDSCPVLYARPAAFQSTPSAWRETQHDIAEEETT